MNKLAIISELNLQFPEKSIFTLPTENPTEIICEVAPSTDHPDFSIAVAVIDRSAPHFHKISTETYRILNGELDLYIDGKRQHLKKDETFIIKPNQVHQRSWS